MTKTPPTTPLLAESLESGDRVLTFTVPLPKNRRTAAGADRPTRRKHVDVILPCPVSDVLAIAESLTPDTATVLSSVTGVDATDPKWRPIALLVGSAQCHFLEFDQQRPYIARAVQMLQSPQFTDREALWGASVLQRAAPTSYEEAILDQLNRGALLWAASQADDPLYERMLHLMTPLLRDQLPPDDVVAQLAFDTRMGGVIRAIRERRDLASQAADGATSPRRSPPTRRQAERERHLEKTIERGLNCMYGILMRGRRAPLWSGGIRPQVWPFPVVEGETGDLSGWQDQDPPCRMRATACLVLDAALIHTVATVYLRKKDSRVVLDWPARGRPSVVLHWSEDEQELLARATVRGADDLWYRATTRMDVRCPNNRASVRCGTCFGHVSRLFLPPGSRSFACGRCTGLPGALVRRNPLGVF